MSSAKHVVAGVLVITVIASLAGAAESSGAAPAIADPRIRCDRWPSAYDAKTWIEDVWRLENAKTDEEKTLALYKWVRLLVHWGEQINDGTRGTSVVECDAVKKINISPYGFCVDFAVAAAALGHAGGLKAVESHIPGHCELEVFYKDADGVERWHRLDPFWGIVVYDKTGQHIATWQEIKADPDVALKPSKTVLPWGDKASDRQRFADKGGCKPDNRVRPARYTMDKPLYPGEVYTLRWDRDAALPVCNANPQLKDKMLYYGMQRFTYAQGDFSKLDFGHELLLPHLEKEGDKLTVPVGHGTLDFRPRLDAGFADSLFAPADNVAVGAAGQPRLHPAKAGAPAELVYLVQTPYTIAGAGFTGTFRAGKGDSVKVSLAYAKWREKDYTLDQELPGKPEWKTVWESKGAGTRSMALKEADLALRGEYRALVKVEMTAGADATSVGVDDLAFALKFQEGVMSLPRLMPGRNTISVSGGAIKPGYALKATYAWDDAQGKDRAESKTIDAFPGQFVIEAAGTKAADIKTKSLSLEAVKK